MYTGSIPATSIYNTWIENVEITSALDDQLVDLSLLTEIKINIRDPYSTFDELVLSLSGGDITLPSLGIIQWRVEQGKMNVLMPKLYEVRLTLEDGTDTIVLILGNISVVQ